MVAERPCIQRHDWACPRGFVAPKWELDLSTQQISDPVSAAFVAARLGGRSLDRFPGELPHSLTDAYGVQSRSIEAWPDDVAGWKIGGIPDPFKTQYGADRLAGPIFSRSVKHAAPGTTAMPVYQGGFAAVEAEYILVFGHDIAPGDLKPSVAAVREAVSAVHIGVEIASSPLPVINDLGPMSIISDFGNNAGLLVGLQVADGTTRDLSSIPVSVDFNGQTIGEAHANADAPFEAAAFLVGLCTERGLTLRKGAMASTGAITGVHQADMGTHSVVRFGDAGTLDLELVPALSQR